MCGIAGFFNYDAKDRDEVLESMSDAIAHRGPDGKGVYLTAELGLAHRRLAIIDLETGDQPMCSVDGRYVTVFNGEIYNYREIRAQLLSKGHEFRTNSDTEIIAESIRAWGVEKAVRDFRGMFAFAVFDSEKQELILARDRTGIKPLYHAFTTDNSSGRRALFFASEQKALLKVSAISRKINPRALLDVLALGYPVTPDTCWDAIKMFPPANFAVMKLGAGDIIPRRYWGWSDNSTPLDMSSALDRAEAVLNDSLKLHLRSDVPIAAFLSGGIDSSLLTTLMLKNGLVDELRTFNVGFNDAKYDESSDAAHVAELAGSIHEEVLMDDASSPEEFERIVAQYDEPYADSSCLPTYKISQVMRRQVKVVISGDGGDELFGGYERFSHISKLVAMKALPGKRTASSLLGFSRAILGGERVRRLQSALKFADLPSSRLITALHTYFPNEESSTFLSKEFAALLEDVAPTWERVDEFVPCGVDSPSERLMRMEQALTLHADYLRKVDIASSAHGLEVRVPFLDSKVIDFASSLPMNLKIKSGTLKLLLRELARKKISDRIADKSKWGFGIPFDKWCRGEMSEYLRSLLFDASADSGVWSVLNRSYSEGLWNLFSDPTEMRRAESQISRFQIYQRIFIMASIQIWFKKWSPEW